MNSRNTIKNALKTLFLGIFSNTYSNINEINFLERKAQETRDFIFKY